MAESKRFLLRLNPELFEALRRWADDDLRSINAQIEYLLADQARRAGRLPAKRAKSSLNADRVRSARNGAGDGKSSDRGGRKRASRARTQA
jgi:hypothetical protein